MKRAAIGFYAYPSIPKTIGTTIDICLSTINNESLSVTGWKELDIPGRFISERVLDGIDAADFLVADITCLNFNVTYEIGYAIGKNKRVLLTRNSSIVEQSPKISEVGIFDTLGYKVYENSAQLSEHINKANKIDPIAFSLEKNKRTPVYLNDSKYKTNWVTSLISRVKKARLFYRSFDPNEQSRLSAYDAIRQVSQVVWSSCSFASKNHRWI